MFIYDTNIDFCSFCYLVRVKGEVCFFSVDSVFSGFAHFDQDYSQEFILLFSDRFDDNSTLVETLVIIHWLYSDPTLLLNHSFTMCTKNTQKTYIISFIWKTYLAMTVLLPNFVLRNRPVKTSSAHYFL